MRFSDRKLLLAGTASAILMGAITPAAAQDAGGTQLDEVVVTATRKSENLSKVPISITALTAKTLDAQGVRDVQDVMRITPGLNIQTTSPFASSSISIRGIFSVVGAATTGVYINDVPVQQRNDAYVLPIYGNLFDVERVEVLRGPQGTLYGAGSEGGTIRFITAAPSVTRQSTYARAELATTKDGAETYEFGVATGGPIMEDKLGFRVSAWGRHDGGWIDRISSREFTSGETLKKDTNSTDSTALRAALLWTPTENLTIQPDVIIQRTLRKDTDLFWERDGRGKQELKLPQPFGTRNNLYSNSVEYRFEPVTVKWIASYLDAKSTRNADESYFDVASLAGQLVVPGFEDFAANFVTSNKQQFATQELRFSSNDSADSRWTWVAGLFWQRNKTYSVDTEYEPSLDQLLPALYGASVEDIFGSPTLADGVTYKRELTSIERQLAGYAEVTFRATDKLKITGGLRVAETEFTFDNYQDGPWNGGPSTGGGTKKEHPVTPKLTVSYDLDSGTAYATAAKGYRIGGANASLGGNLACRNEVRNTLGLDDVPLSYDSDSVMSYEAGLKRRFLSDRLSVAASAYWINWKDIQSNVQLKCFFNYTANLGKAVSRGGDLSLRFDAAPGLILGADLGYGDAHYSETFRLDNGQVLALKGDDLPTPAFTAALSAAYDWSINSDLEGYARGDLNYSSAYNRNPAPGVFGNNELLRRMPSMTLVSGRVGVRRGDLDLSLFVNNLFDTDRRNYRYHYSGVDDILLSQTVRPRTVGVTLTWAR